jgi:hypothetical protein
MADLEPAAGDGPVQAGTTRRGMLRGAAGIGVAGLTAGVLAGAVAGPAAASTAGTNDEKAAPHGEPLVARRPAFPGRPLTPAGHLRLTPVWLALNLPSAGQAGPELIL